MLLQSKSLEQWAKNPQIDTLPAQQGRKWCALENEGVSCFGALGLNYKISSWWLGVFHGRGGIVEVFLKFIKGNDGRVRVQELQVRINFWCLPEKFKALGWVCYQPLDKHQPRLR